jgi:hypothetical protein
MDEIAGCIAIPEPDDSRQSESVLPASEQQIARDPLTGVSRFGLEQHDDDVLESVLEGFGSSLRSPSVGMEESALYYNFEVKIVDDDGSPLWAQAVLVTGSSAAVPGLESIPAATATADQPPATDGRGPARSGKRRRRSASSSRLSTTSSYSVVAGSDPIADGALVTLLGDGQSRALRPDRTGLDPERDDASGEYVDHRPDRRHAAHRPVRRAERPGPGSRLPVE